MYVVHDRDKDGQSGGLRQAELIATVADEVRWVELPYPLADKHGKDLRDYLAEGHWYSELLDLAEASRVIPRPKQQLEEKATTDPYTRSREICHALGLHVIGDRPDMRVVVFSEGLGRTNEIKRPAQLTKADLLQICGPVVHEKIHESNEVVPGMYHIRTVREAIASLASRTRLSHDTAKGRGIWLGRDRDCLVLVGASEALVWSFAQQQLKRLRQPFAGGYLLDLSAPDPWFDLARLELYLEYAQDVGWRRRVVEEVTTWIEGWYWQQATVPWLFTGLLMATWLQSVWSWRPHVAIRGASSSGKSMFFRGLSAMFSHLGFLTAKPTEAGLRQHIGSSSEAIFVDEFESDLHRSKILELLRTSGRGAKQVRGTTDQQGRQFALQHIVWVAAVEVNLHREPDANRFVAVEMNKPPADRHGDIEEPDPDRMADLGARLLAACLRCFPDALEVSAQLRRHRLPGFGARTIENYAPAAALLALATENEPVAILERLLIERESEEGGRATDQEDALEAILGAVLDIGHGERATVAQVLQGGVDHGPAACERVGIRPLGEQGFTGDAWSETYKRQTLFIDCKSVSRYLMRGTAWESQSLDQILLRLDGAKAGRRIVGGRQPRGLLIPWKLVQERFLGADDPGF